MRFASDIQPEVRQDPIDQYLGALANAKSYIDQNMPRLDAGISQIMGTSMGKQIPNGIPQNLGANAYEPYKSGYANFNQAPPSKAAGTSDYVNKLRERYNDNLDLYNKYINAESIFKILDKELYYYDKAVFSIIHGDPVFTNVLQTEQGLRFIDMKGKIDGELTIIGDTYYDLAKVYQSVLGYDFILNDIELDNVYINEFKTMFESLFNKEGLRNLKIITASLFFTLMPLHTEDQDKFAKYFKIINTLLDEFRDN